MKSLLLVLILIFSSRSFGSASLFDQAIDHKHSDAGKFKQRYLVSNEFADSKSSPVLFYLCGEWNCFQDTDGIPAFVKLQARKFHANIVVLEHRYFGESMPFKTLSKANLRFLTVENALIDAANLQRSLSQSLTGSWIVIGGSYGGTLAAFYRLKYANNVVGALASSAPVRTRWVMTEYTSYREKLIGADCLDKINNFKKTIVLMDIDDLKKIRATFEIPIDASVKDLDIFITAHVNFYAQYGLIKNFCESVKSEGADKTLRRYVPFYSREIAWLKFSNFTNATDLSKEDASLYVDSGARQWLYMQCSQLGYFGSQAEAESCNVLFGTLSFDSLWRRNRDYYEQLINKGSEIIFTNGSNDPYSRYSITPDLGNDKNTQLDTIWINGASHCSDLNIDEKTEDNSLLFAASQISNLFKQWIMPDSAAAI